MTILLMKSQYNRIYHLLTQNKRKRVRFIDKRQRGE